MANENETDENGAAADQAAAGQAAAGQAAAGQAAAGQAAAGQAAAGQAAAGQAAAGQAAAGQAAAGQAGAAAAGRSVTRLTDPRALRAYAHPVRMKLVGLLRTEGPLTATRAAELLGESSGTCSFHLRQLAKYGLVEEAGGGTGREKPWRATTTTTSWDAIGPTPEVAAAASMLNTAMAEEYFEQLMRWLEARPGEPAEWQESFLFGDQILYVTAAELAELGRQVRGLVGAYFERQVKPELRPPGSRQVSYLHLAFPNDFRGRRS